jgi:hypothetical protein
MKNFLFLFFISVVTFEAIAQKFANATLEPFTKTNFLTSVIDFDNDGDDDVFGWQNHILNSTFLYRNDGKNIFTDVTNSKNFSKRNNGVAADLDKNGFSDIYWINGDTLRYAFYNGTTFSTVPNSVGCGFQYLSTLFNTTSSNIKLTKFGDFDNDGIYDLVAHIINGTSSGIYAIKGIIASSGCNFSFETKLQTLITFSNTNTTSIQFADIDNDSDFDLLTGQGTSAFQNYNYALYINSGKGIFTQLSNSGFDIGRVFSFGTLGDLNNDGKIDVVSGAGDCCVTGNPVSLYLSSKNETKFNVNSTAIKRVNNPYYFQANLVDINLDKLQDIYWTFMASFNNIPTTQCFINAGNNIFNENSTELNLNVGKPSVSTTNVDNKSTIIDIDNDLKPDVVGSSYHPFNGTTYTNYQRINTSTNNSVKLKLDACTGLREGWGARIKYLSDGTWTYQQHSGYASSNYPFLYLGMGSATKIDSLIIEWVGGKISYIHNVPAGSYLSISETDKCAFSPCVNPIAAITPQGSTSICQGEYVLLNASTGNNYLYQWYANGQSINGANSSVYKVITSGSYSVKVINGGCSEISSSISVNVNAYPSSGVKIYGDSTFCQGNSVLLESQGDGSYVWSNGSTSKSIEVLKSGKYFVQVTSNGCSSKSQTISINVNPLPKADIYPSGVIKFCQGDSVRLIASGGINYTWNNGSKSNTIMVNKGESYYVYVENEFKCKSLVWRDILEISKPKVSIFNLNDFTFKNQSPIQLVGSPSGGTFSGDGVYASLFDPNKVSLGKKTILYNFISTEGCKGSASRSTFVVDSVGNVCNVTKYDTITFTDTISILKIKFKMTTGLQANKMASMSLYPNPTTDVLHIEIGDAKALEGYRYRILDALGKEVYNELVKNTITEIPLKSLGAAGMYQFEVVDAKNVRIQANKIVLQ